MPNSESKGFPKQKYTLSLVSTKNTPAVPTPNGSGVVYLRDIRMSE